MGVVSQALDFLEYLGCSWLVKLNGFLLAQGAPKHQKSLGMGNKIWLSQGSEYNPSVWVPVLTGKWRSEHLPSADRMSVGLKRSRYNRKVLNLNGLL